MDKRMKTALILGGVAVAAYLVYRWYENRQNNQSVSPLGTNLNSASPSVLSSLSAGPSTELNYYGSNPNTTTQTMTTPITTSQSSSTSATGTGSGSGTTSDQTSSPAGQIVGWSNVLANAGNNYTGASPSDFLAAFQATGQNAGQIVPGGTGQPIPLQPGQSYTS